jgi:hypothetical protein
MYMGEFVYSMTRTRTKRREQENRKRMKNKRIARERKDRCLGIYIDRRIRENRKKPIDSVRGHIAGEKTTVICPITYRDKTNMYCACAYCRNP